MVKRKGQKDVQTTQWSNEKDKKMYRQHNGQTKRTKRCTDNTMVKRKGQKDEQTTQWSNVVCASFCPFRLSIVLYVHLFVLFV
jgi:hypothetical protein